MEVYSRLDDGRWAQSVYLPGTTARIPSVGLALPLDELYENAVFDDEPASPIDVSKGVILLAPSSLQRG